MLRYTIEIVGWTAAVVMLAAYLLLTNGKISARSSLYHWLNVLSGVGFILNSGWNGAYPSACINIVWVAIGCYGIFGRSTAESAATAE
jgi:formate hydrogenlyase subunit 3/multisubunit Na+/H+ antiporter MnhD subunit